MQVSQARNQSVWKQVYQDALFETDQARLRPKLEAALRAVDDRLFEVRSNPPDRRELTELEDAKRAIGYLSKVELET
ncbi:MAG: hypothetical protein DMG76_20360 [Acidobacteria bacterium]|nr:MAG: hypothetical protein DMG76_20360 [Acidobacteriota bacterium]